MTKHVEGYRGLCLDEGSTPSGSTNNTEFVDDVWFQMYDFEKSANLSVLKETIIKPHKFDFVGFLFFKCWKLEGKAQ